MPFNKSKALEEATKLVGQRKLSQAIKQYLAIMEKDPADLSLLNIVGDLYVREGNIPEALRQYYKLGAAYAHEGFSLKAIAIYKKIAKLDVRSIEPLTKLAELYSSQGLSREAREQYAQALAFCQSHSLPEKAAEILGKLIAQDPEGASYRIRLGELHEAAGRAREASLAYLEAAEIARRRKDVSAADVALGKASRLDPHNGRVALFAARMAVENGRFDDADKFLNGSAPEIKASREARLIRLELYLRTQKLDEAVAAAVEIYRDDPANFQAIEHFTNSCLQANNPDAALAPLGAIVDVALERQQTAPIAAILRRILQAQPHHVSSLELLHAIYERGGAARFGDELLEELGGAFTKAGEWTSAAKVYRQLLDHAEDNPTWQARLNEALSHQGGARQETGTVESSPAAEPAAQPITAESATSPEATPAPGAGRESKLGREPVLEPVSVSDVLSSPFVGPASAIEVDFSSEWKEYSATSRISETAAASDLALPLEEEEKAEVQFYLEYGFFAEARARLENLVAAHPGHPELAELRKKLEDAEGAEASPSQADAAPEGAGRIDSRLAAAQQESPTFPETEPASPAETCSSASQAGAPEAQAQQASLLDELRLDLETSIVGSPTAQISPPVRPMLDGHEKSGASMDSDSVSTVFHELLADLESEHEQHAAQDSPQAHYNLGVAFREMGLLDEAIAEFQKVVRGTDKQDFPPRFLEACSALGMCFMEKAMPAIALRWYQRALEAPGIDEETSLGLNYDLGCAFEESGDPEAAFEKFSEVYSLNIDYRDVAEKLHSLQRKQR